MNSTQLFLNARNQLVHLRDDLEAAQRDFDWPAFVEFNWARDYFDFIAARNERPALRVVDDRGGDVTLSYAEISARAN